MTIVFSLLYLPRPGRVFPGWGLTELESSVTSLSDNLMPLIPLPSSLFDTPMNQNLGS